jgi:glycine/D-amino acid oxidase-like deaminating enzyme/nitrite reductase/ring-hydroxylating ferredoxin subunit
MAANGARLVAESHVAAIEQIETITKVEDIYCGFAWLDGYLFHPPGKSSRLLATELAACHQAGLKDAEIIPRAPLPFFDTGECIRFPRQAQMNPLIFLRGLAQAIVRDGGRIFTDSHAVRIEGGSRAAVTTASGYRIHAKHIVVTTNTPVNDLVVIHTKQAAYRTYVVGGRIPMGSVTKALYWDTGDPYHYVRIESAASLRPLPSSPAVGEAEDILLIGGEDHKTGQEPDAASRFMRLKEWAVERFPMLQTIDFQWSGQILEPVDALAFIGSNPMDANNVYIATGSSGNGMTYGAIAGILIRDLVLGRKNPWAALYDPSRITLGAVKEFAKENLNTATKYGDWLTPGDVDSVSEIAPGSGAITRRGLKKIAVYRDPSGCIHECSASCSHLGGVVAWNSAESSWDCPCHGSRFDPFGKVINGPAVQDLARVDGPAAAPVESVPPPLVSG